MTADLASILGKISFLNLMRFSVIIFLDLKIGAHFKNILEKIFLLKFRPSKRAKIKKIIIIND